MKTLADPEAIKFYLKNRRMDLNIRNVPQTHIHIIHIIHNCKCTHYIFQVEMCLDEKKEYGMMCNIKTVFEWIMFAYSNSL